MAQRHFSELEMVLDSLYQDISPVEGDASPDDLTNRSEIDREWAHQHLWKNDRWYKTEVGMSSLENRSEVTADYVRKMPEDEWQALQQAWLESRSSELDMADDMDIPPPSEGAKERAQFLGRLTPKGQAFVEHVLNEAERRNLTASWSGEGFNLKITDG
jgi:hypothetical protein